jgi:hypothetical protein
MVSSMNLYIYIYTHTQSVEKKRVKDFKRVLYSLK